MLGNGATRSRGTQEEQAGRLGIPLRSPCGAVHLGLRSLQLAARPLPGSCLLIQLLPQPCRLRLQGSCPGPQGQLCSGLLLQQLLKRDGRMDVTCGQERGEAWGEPGGERWAGITWASWSWASMLVSSLLSLMALDSASLSAPDTISSSACREGTSSNDDFQPANPSAPLPLIPTTIAGEDAPAWKVQLPWKPV